MSERGSVDNSVDGYLRFLDIGGSSGENDRLNFIRNAGFKISPEAEMTINTK